MKDCVRPVALRCLGRTWSNVSDKAGEAKELGRCYRRQDKTGASVYAGKKRDGRVLGLYANDDKSTQHPHG